MEVERRVSGNLMLTVSHRSNFSIFHFLSTQIYFLYFCFNFEKKKVWGNHTIGGSNELMGMCSTHGALLHLHVDFVWSS